MPRRYIGAIVGFLALSCCAAGCSDNARLIATPNIDLDQRGHATFQHVPEKLQTTEIPILFAADRAVMKQTLFGPRYGFGRSGYLTFGAALVGITPELSWDEFVEVSTERKRPRSYKLELKVAVEFGRLALPITGMEVREGRYRLNARQVEQIEASRQRLHEILAERLSESHSEDVYIFVHGFNNTFEDAIFRLAQVWHFMGRRGVPIAYTWPAGKGGIFGYAYDRESGDFTVYHLKKFLVAVATCPQVKRVHIIAHSRGTDVVTTALRELNIEYKAKGDVTAQQLKLTNLVLAAPDMDADVFEQRFGIEDLHAVAERTTVYLSKSDFALGVSNWLFGGRSRLGNLTAEKFTPEASENLAKLGNFDLISCDVSGYSTSHDYAFAHPAVVSDLILVLRDRRAPGAANGRPLESPARGIWQIDNDYLLAPDEDDALAHPTPDLGTLEPVR